MLQGGIFHRTQIYSLQLNFTKWFDSLAHNGYWLALAILFITVYHTLVSYMCSEMYM